MVIFSVILTYNLFLDKDKDNYRLKVILRLLVVRSKVIQKQLDKGFDNDI